MLKRVKDGVLTHQSAFLQTNTVVVPGPDGVLLVDPGLQDSELDCLADDLPAPVVAGFSTHPHWDHLLWHARFGEAPRYGTAPCAAAARKQASDPDMKARITDHLAGTEIAGRVPLDLFGLITAVPSGTEELPWDGAKIRIIEHRAHAPGHAALFIEEHGVLVAGDMLSDVLIPMLDRGADDPIGDYLAALRLLEDVAAGVDLVVPGHGSVGGPGEALARIEQDRAYVVALRDGRAPDDPRIGDRAEPGWEWVGSLHEGQAQALSGRRLEGRP
jgi:glyoxylase-like metal-dependent hydrolase (beta-lactamase superfamily II)